MSTPSATMADVPPIGDGPLPDTREDLRRGLADACESRAVRMFAGANVRAVLHAIRDLVASDDTVADAILARIVR